VRKQLKRDIPQAEADEAEQLTVLDTYASGILSALNRDGLAPFDFATVEAAEDLDEVEASLQQLAKKGTCEPALCAKAGTFAVHCGRADSLGELARPDQALAWLGFRGGTHPGQQLGA
jgi:hypothetical protein